jgi:hypothetical protein
MVNPLNNNSSTEKKENKNSIFLLVFSEKMAISLLVIFIFLSFPSSMTKVDGIHQQENYYFSVLFYHMYVT